MRHLKYFESKIDMSDHKLAIKDILQSLIDDYDMIDADKDKPGQSNVDKSYYYAIHDNIPNVKNSSIVLQIVTGRAFGEEAEFTEELKLIIDRIKSIGYEVASNYPLKNGFWISFKIYPNINEGLKKFESFEEDIKDSLDGYSKYNKIDKEEVRQHMMIIRDIFQDVIDEWSIEYNYNNELDHINGLYYFIEYAGDDDGDPYIIFDISSIEDYMYAESDIIKNIDLTDEIKRLENMGYVVSKEKNEFSEKGANITLKIKMPE